MNVDFKRPLAFERVRTELEDLLLIGPEDGTPLSVPNELLLAELEELSTGDVRSKQFVLVTQRGRGHADHVLARFRFGGY